MPMRNSGRVRKPVSTAARARTPSMRVDTPSRRAFVGGALLMAGSFWAPAAGARGHPVPSLWEFFEVTLRRARYIDLTHAMAPGGPIGEGFVDFKVGAARAGV